MKKILLLSLLSFIFMQNFAGERTEMQMRNAAMQVLNKKHTRAASGIELKEFLSLSKLKIYGYEDGGFAVVSSDDRFNEVIGYSASRFREAAPCGFNWWMETINKSMSNASQTKKTASARRRIKSQSAVSPLLKTIWGQERPFNDECVFINDKKTYQCVTGCVATALAQVMNYYQYPESGTGSNSYDVKYNNSFTITFSEDFSQSVYDWGNMLDSYLEYKNTHNKDEHTRAVAKLMWDCGIATGTSFSDSAHGSSSSLRKVDNALKTYFYYDESTQYYSRSDYENSDWMGMIYNELDNGRPVLYSGADSDSSGSVGHAFVLNGYDSAGNVYVNWGWNGYCDGYFDIDLLNPDDEHYDHRQAMVIVVPGNNADTPKMQTLTITANGSGTVYYGGMEGIQIRGEYQSFKVREGSNIELLLSPDLGSSVKSVKVNGSDVTSSLTDNSYKIKNISSSTDVEVEFEVSADVSTGNYNAFITCANVSSSTSIIGTTVSKSVGFQIMNSGNEDIYINKLIARDPDSNDVILSSTDTDVLGELKAGATKSLSLKTSRDVLPTYEMEYTLNDKRYVYDMSKYKVLMLTSNNFGYISYSGIYVGNDTRKFSVEPSSDVTIELIAKDGSVFSKLLEESSDVTSKVVDNKYVISNMTTNMSLTATFDALNSIGGHEYVDLGLPSGKYWSTMNYGANTPEEAGDYTDSRGSDIVKSWGEEWNMPTKEDMQELVDNCEWTWTEQNGAKGYLLKGPNSNTMFLPAAGQEDRVFGGVSGLGSSLKYLTSSENISGRWILSGNSTAYKLTTTYIILDKYSARPISTYEPPTYKLIYMLDGTEYKTVEYREGSIITSEVEPTKEGYTFSGWSEIPETMPAHDVTITGSFTINKYKLIYIVDDEEYKSYEIEYGASITPESAPAKDGYIFSGWSEIPTAMPAQDVTVTGSFTINKYKLTYTVDDEEYKIYELDYGASITPEVDPTKEGYTFSGWSEIPETMPAHDVTVTGSFTINKYKLIYMVDDEEYKSYEIEYGASITPESAPTKEGYIFSGWSEIPEIMPAYDVTVTGSFTEDSYILTYIVDGEAYETVTYTYGDVIISEVEPTKEGYTFSGWSEIPETMPAHDVTVTGSFTINKYKLIYIVDDEEYKSYEIEYGASITPESAPAKDGYIFSGWSEIPTAMPAQDVTVTGSFTINKYKLTYTVDGEEYKTYELDYGAGITPEVDPTKEGYTFSGWSEIPETMPAHDVDVMGTFSINSYKLTYMIDDKVYKEAMCEYGAIITPEPQPDGDYATFEWKDLPQTMPAHDVVVCASYTTGIIDVLMTKYNIRIYSPNGKKQDKLQKGLNIVVLDDGTVKKVMVK